MNWDSELLSGELVELAPLDESHFDGLWAVAQHPEIWAYMPFAAGDSRDHFEMYLRHMLSQQDKGQALPFTTRLHGTGQIVGSSSFLAIDESNRRLEIGATWVTPEMQRSRVNTEAKYLQLSYAFEKLACNRVEFKTDSLNQKSRAALKRIGATEEGTFRNHMVMPDGRIRHSVWFSITNQEWPDVRKNLLVKL